jgi:hypothetical protein
MNTMKTDLSVELKRIIQRSIRRIRMPSLASRKDLHQYCITFMSIYRKVLKKNVGYRAKAVVSTKQGSLVFFTFRVGPSFFSFKKTLNPVGKALEKLPQSAFGGDLSGVRFGGKNVIREGNKLIVIKGDNSREAWSRIQAIRDAREEIEAVAEW